MIYYRNKYIDKLFEYKDKKVIKVITGVRRCGKSVVLKSYVNEITRQNTNLNMLFLSMESFSLNHLLEDNKLFYKHICDNLDMGKKGYLFIDEIQLVEGFEVVINSIFAETNIDIYITGSNGFILSNDISTLLSGRYVELHIYPFSYIESREYFRQMDKSHSINEFLLKGAMPVLFDFYDNKNTFNSFISSLIDSIVVKDILLYNKNIDQKSLNSVVNYLLDNIGNITNIKKIADYMTSNSYPVSRDKVGNIIFGVTKSFLFYECRRFDISGKKYLTINSKYYVSDLSFRYSISPLLKDIGRVIENVVYLELLKRNYEVSVGKIGNLEIDFIAIKNNERKYIQVSQTIMDDVTLNREILPFKKLKDGYERILITDDKYNFELGDGIRHVLLEEFIQSDSKLN